MFRSLGWMACLSLALVTACGGSSGRLGDGGRGADGAACAATCTENAQCDFGNACREGCCRQGCDSDEDCGNGQVCRSDRCVNPNADAGAGRADGGATRDGGITARDGGTQTRDGGAAADGGPARDGGGTGAGVGAACADDGDCAGGLCITDLPGGYCTQLDCDATPCPEGSTCFTVSEAGDSACFKDCGSASDCRTSEGYTCDADNTCYPATPTDGGTPSSDGGATATDGGPAGTRPIGDACTAGSQCAGGGCLGLPGGYCTKMGCSMSSPCPSGSLCFGIGNNQTACFKECTDPAQCRVSEGYTCDADNTCYTGTAPMPCSAANPQGSCPSGQVCQNGMCQTFTCNDTRFEPNETQTAAASLPAGTTTGLGLCANDKDWYRVTVEPTKITTVGVTFQNTAGDLDVRAYTSGGQCLGGRIATYCGNYSGADRGYETNEEYVSFLNGAATGNKTYAVQVSGATSSVANQYTLTSQVVPWRDGRDCTEVDSNTPCNGGGSMSNLKLMQFPYADPNDPYVGDGYRFDSMTSYRWARRELVQLVRYAIKETQAKFADTKPLGLIDICQRDGITPGYDVDDPRHPETTHDQGGNIDIAYYTTLASAGSLAYNEARIICGATESANNDGSFCTSAASTQHVVDLPRQVYFMAKLFESARVRVIGVDRVIGPLLRTEAQRQQGLGWISSTLAGRFNTKMAFGDGWPFHHHHIHVSLMFWNGKPGAPAPAEGCGFDLKRHRAARLKQNANMSFAR